MSEGHANAMRAPELLALRDCFLSLALVCSWHTFLSPWFSEAGSPEAWAEMAHVPSALSTGLVWLPFPVGVL